MKHPSQKVFFISNERFEQNCYDPFFKITLTEVCKLFRAQEKEEKTIGELGKNSYLGFGVFY